MNKEKGMYYKNEPTSKSIFDYVTDVNRFKNEKDFASVDNKIQKPFIQEASFSLTGVPAKQVDVENEMRGNNKILSSYACKELSKMN